ncbi:hypothetical protein D9M71_632890 [compost metagenome]
MVRRARQYLLEQRQGAVVTAIQPLRLQRRFGPAQQRADTGAFLLVVAQPPRHGIGVALRYLQLAGQRQRALRGGRIAGIECGIGLCQCGPRSARQACAGLRTIAVQCQRRLVPLARAAAIARGQPAGRQRTVAPVQQLLHLRFVPEPVRQRAPECHQQHEHRHRHQQRPAPDAPRLPRLHPPPAAFAAHAAQGGMRGVLMVGGAAHSVCVAWVT